MTFRNIKNFIVFAHDDVYIMHVPTWSCVWNKKRGLLPEATEEIQTI